MDTINYNFLRSRLDDMSETTGGQTVIIYDETTGEYIPVKAVKYTEDENDVLPAHLILVCKS